MAVTVKSYEGTSMNVSLTPEAERVVNEKIESGEFQNPSEVVEAALRALEDHDIEKERDRIDGLIREGLASEVSDMTEQDWKNIRLEAAALAKSRKSA
jgi:antitoxin ParD1/3/4